MEHLVLLLRRFLLSNARSFCLCLTLVSLTLLTGCPWDPLGLDDITKQIDKTRQSIVAESTGWRDELKQLADVTLPGMESKVSADVKGILADTVNQVTDLRNETFKLAENDVTKMINEAGAEYRCNVQYTSDFVKQGVVASLQNVIDDLNYWKSNKTHKPDRPNHTVCGLTPDVLQIYKTGSGWKVDTTGMSDPNILRVFGYNFWSDKLPSLELQSNGATIRTLSLKPDYVTRYQFNLDFSNETFSGVQSGTNAQIVFRWPDQPDPNTVTLTQLSPGVLRISNPVFSGFNSPSPHALKDSVYLKVTITNIGGSPVQSCNINWHPDPKNDPLAVPSVAFQHALLPSQSSDFTLGPYQYRQGGPIQGTVSLSTGDPPLSISLNVQSPPSTQPCGPFGGQGGGTFTELFGANPTGIRFSSGQYLDSFQMIYPTGFGPQYGGSGGSPVSINFSAGEYIQGVNIHSGQYVDQITIYTNRRTLGPFGGSGGGPNPICGGPGQRVIGFIGRSGQYLDALGVILQR